METISADRAVGHFQEICGNGGPVFESSQTRAQKAGFGSDTADPFIYTDTNGTEIYIGPADDGEPLCAIDFATADTRSEVDIALGMLGRLTETQPGIRIGRYRDTLMRVRGPITEPRRTSDRYILELKPEG